MGNLDLEVDIGYAPDFMEAAIRILELDKPDDFIVSTGKGYSIKQMIEMAYLYNGISNPWSCDVVQDADRPNQPTLIGDNSKVVEATGMAFNDLKVIIPIIMDELK